MKHEIKVPSAGESVTEVYIGKWMKKSGDIVKKGDVLVELESQKATFQLESEYSGKLDIHFPNVGDKVAVGETIATIDDSVAPDQTPTTSDKSKPSMETRSTPSSATLPPMSPSVRRALSEKQIDPGSLKGTGPDGRVLMQDLERPQTKRPLETTAIPSPAVTMPSKEPAYAYEGDESRGVRREKASRIRQEIAKNLVKAQHTAAILTTFNEVDMTQVLDFRKRHKDELQKKHGVAVGILGFFALAAARSLKQYPLVNAMYTGTEVIYHDYIDLSIAVSTDRGLVVPVVRDLDKLNLISFEKEMARLAERAREGKISIPEMTGGTFTISNGGVFGSLMSTPLLNMPQSAILGLHKTQQRPMAVNDQVVIRPMMYLALSYDHRLIDGKEAVQFLVAIKEAVENLDLIIDLKDYY